MVGGALGLLLARAHGDINAAAVYSMTFNYDGWNMSRWYSASAHLLRPIANLPVVRNISFAEPYLMGYRVSGGFDIFARSTLACAPSPMAKTSMRPSSLAQT